MFVVLFKNKEDLFVSTYMSIKSGIVRAMISDFDDILPIRDILIRVWVNLFQYISGNRADFQFAEQFANSP